MLRISIRATPDTDVDAELENLRRAANGAGLDPAALDHVLNEAQTVVRDFVNRGRELKALGSQLNAERHIRGDGYDIHVSFNTVQRSGVFARLLAAFGR